MNEKPEEPKEEDCCHNDCTNCIFDIYKKSLKDWKCNQHKKEDIRYDLLSVTRFKPFVLLNVKQLTVDTNLYVLKPHTDNGINVAGYLPYHSGQYLLLRIEKEKLANKSCVEENREYPFIMRDFTIVSLSKEHSDCSLEILIKLYKTSPTSNYIKNLQVGDILFWRGPYGDFKHEVNVYSEIIMLCMGTGIAPMYPIIKEIVTNENDDTIISLLFGCRTSNEIILRAELRELSSYWNFNCTHFLSDEKDLTNKKYNEHFELSKISANDISHVLYNKSGYIILICGSPEFVQDMNTILLNLNVPNNKIYVF